MAPRNPEKSSPSSRGRAWLKWSCWGALALLVIPIIEVGCVRGIDPPITPLMLLRPLEARLEKKPSRIRYYNWIPLSQMPRDFLQAVVLSEDQRFFQHHGFDWKQIAIARQEAERKGKSPRGASTITMQCARSLFLWQGRSWVRKGLEAYYTFWMERLLSKRRILELYANVIETGDGVYGLEAAAQFHYKRTAARLTRDQNAMIAALLPNPRHWDPHQPNKALTRRHARILEQIPRSAVVFPR